MEPLLLPTSQRHRAFLFCFARALADKHSDAPYCMGCRYNLCSQSSHFGCRTLKQRQTLEQIISYVGKSQVSKYLVEMSAFLKIDAYILPEFNMLFRKCKKDWKKIAIDSVLYGFVCYPNEWLYNI